jgi:hypothetical protein
VLEVRKSPRGGEGDRGRVAVYTATDTREAMPRRSREEVDERLEAVERALLELPWTVSTQRALGTQYGVGARQIREDASKVRARWAKEAKKNTSEEHRADWLQRVRAAQSHAIGQNQSIALSRLLQLEARCMGFESPIEVQVNHTVEAMSPVEQAQAIVESYEDARRYLETVTGGPPALEASFECLDTSEETGGPEGGFTAD